jgi:acyl carrier protein
MVEIQIRKLLSQEFGLPTEALASTAPIFSAGLLDSLSSIRLVLSLEQYFGIHVSPLDISLEDVDTIESIAGTVIRLRG